MTAAPTTERVGRLADDQIPEVVRWLSAPGPGDDPRDPILWHQVVLDALDRGHRSSFLVWPSERPRAVCLVGSGGRIVPAGDPEGGAALAEAVGAGSWRVVIGPESIAGGMLSTWGHPGAPARSRSWRRRTSVRQQRFMRVLAEDVVDLPPPAGTRLARPRDLDAITELAARLHVEDLGRPPLSRAGRSSVRARMRDSIDRGDTFVVEEDGQIVAKTDVSLFSPSRGGQIAGVYVIDSHRGRGLAKGLVAAATRSLVLEGLPGVTLHVRSDNTPAIRAYERGGYVDRGPLTLAMR